MNLPNRLTVVRILFVPVVLVCLLIEFHHHYLCAGIFFGLASITDYFDGKIARERNLITNFGKFADPLADKILIVSVLLCFVELKIVSCIPVIILLFREFFVTSIRLVSASSGVVLAANIFGKLKTVSQIVAVSLIFLLKYILELMQMDIIKVNINTYILWESVFKVIGICGIWISTVVALISGAIYLKSNINILKT